MIADVKATLRLGCTEVNLRARPDLADDPSLRSGDDQTHTQTRPNAILRQILHELLSEDLSWISGQNLGTGEEYLSVALFITGARMLLALPCWALLGNITSDIILTFSHFLSHFLTFYTLTTFTPRLSPPLACKTFRFKQDTSKTPRHTVDPRIFTHTHCVSKTLPQRFSSHIFQDPLPPILHEFLLHTLCLQDPLFHTQYLQTTLPSLMYFLAPLLTKCTSKTVFPTIRTRPSPSHEAP